MKTQRIILGLAITLTSFVMSACLDDPDVPTAEEILEQQLAAVDQTKLASDIDVIDDSLALWGITPLIQANGVRYTIEEMGTGTKPTLNNIISAHYVGRLLKDGQEGDPFDQSQTGQPLTIFLSDLIVGWKLVLPLLPNGTKATLYIPSGFGYGNNTIRDENNEIVIPPNSILIFEVELINVQ